MFVMFCVSVIIIIFFLIYIIYEFFWSCESNNWLLSFIFLNSFCLFPMSLCLSGNTILIISIWIPLSIKYLLGFISNMEFFSYGYGCFDMFLNSLFSFIIFITNFLLNFIDFMLMVFNVNLSSSLIIGMNISMMEMNFITNLFILLIQIIGLIWIYIKICNFYIQFKTVLSTLFVGFTGGDGRSVMRTWDNGELFSLVSRENVDQWVELPIHKNLISSFLEGFSSMFGTDSVDGNTVYFPNLNYIQAFITLIVHNYSSHELKMSSNFSIESETLLETSAILCFTYWVELYKGLKPFVNVDLIFNSKCVTCISMMIRQE